MAIKRKKKHGRIYREEYKSIRVDGKVKSIYVRSLGPENPVDKVPKPKPKVLDRLEHGSSHRAGDAALLWELARELDFVNTIDRICCEGEVEGISPGKLLTAWAINRAIDPICATELENWIPITDLPRLMGLNPTDFTKEAFLTALDFVCYEDRGSGRFIDFTKQIDEALYRRWRKRHPLHPGEKETIAYDLTSVLFFGVTCPLAELGYNPKGIKRRQVNLALIVSRQDKCPVTHFVYNGGRNSSSTVKNLLTRLMDTSIEPGTVIWDRGNVSKTHVENVESAGWKLICGLPKTSREVRNIIDKTDIPLDPNTFIHKSRSGHIYADKTRGQLFGRERSAVVYVNQNQRIGEINAQNEALAEIADKLMKVRNDAVKDETRLAIKKIAIELQKSTDHEIWDEFEVRFKQVHNDFYDKLMLKFPNLSPSEQRLSAFLRLNMTTKEISELTGQRPESLDTARVRLRKKLGISNTRINLVNFLSQI